jgi:hypothetical protein
MKTLINTLCRYLMCTKPRPPTPDEPWGPDAGASLGPARFVGTIPVADKGMSTSVCSQPIPLLRSLKPRIYMHNSQWTYISYVKNYTGYAGSVRYMYDLNHLAHKFCVEANQRATLRRTRELIRSRYENQNT